MVSTHFTANYSEYCLFAKRVGLFPLFDQENSCIHANCSPLDRLGELWNDNKLLGQLFTS